MDKMYKCVCGFTTTKRGKYAGHCRHCKEHLMLIGKLEKIQDADRRAAQTGQSGFQKKAQIRKATALEKWVSEKHKCKTCGKIMSQKYGSGVYCCRSCANTRTHSEETRQKIQQGAVQFYKNKQPDARSANSPEKQKAYYQNPNFCKICKNVLPYEKRMRKTCGSEKCLNIAFQNAGISSAAIVVKRSKNEIAFCELCESYFGEENVLHNVALFNGWDADIILLNEKIAILWNGPWHYRKIKEKHHLQQVQNRDKIKIKEIERQGFVPYVIRDNSDKKSNIVVDEFNKLLEYISNRANKT